MGTGTSGGIGALTVYDGSLYASGYFYTAGGVSAKYIARWNGIVWDSLSSGTNGNVAAMAVYDNELYAAGGFYMAGGMPANYIAKWNGSAWSSVGTGVGSPLNCLAGYNSALYVGGSIHTAGSISVSRVAKWNGVVWDSVGSGIVSDVLTMTAFDGSLYEGNGLLFTGGQYEWMAQWTSPVGIEENNNSISINIYPNPFYSKTNIEIAGSLKANAEFRMFNILGKEVFRSEIISSNTEITREGLLAGIYFINILSGNQVVSSQKIIIQ